MKKEYTGAISILNNLLENNKKERFETKKQIMP
jgi:hypothetical protein